MSELYPKIDETNSFRLQKINEITTYFEKEIEHYREVLRKYKKAESVTSVVDMTSAVGSIALCLGSIGMNCVLVALPTLAPVVVSIEVVGIAISAGSILINRLHKRFLHKIVKHEAILTCALTKLNTTHDIYSKALEDGKIDTAEFKLLLDEKDKYIALKNAIRKHSVDSEQKYNIEEIKKEFLEKGKQLGKNEVLEKLKGAV